MVTSLLDGSAVGLLLTGAAIGALLAVGAVAAATLVGRWRPPSIPASGLILTIPLALVADDLGVLAWLGLLTLVAGGLVGWRFESVLIRAAATIPGALLLTFDLGEAIGSLVLIGVPAATALVATFEDGHDHEHGLSAMCAAIAGGGAFLTLPDTEHIALIAGAGVAVGLAVLAEPRLTMGMSTPVWIGAFLWAVATDGTGRAASMVGAVGALGLLIIDPAVRSSVPLHRGLLTYLPTRSERAQLIGVAVIQTVLAVFAARVAGFGDNVTVALVLVAVSWCVVGWALTFRARQLQ